MELVLKSSEICAVFGITDRTLRRWKTYGAPNKGRDEWDFYRVFAWWTDFFIEQIDDEQFDAVFNRAAPYGADFDDYLWHDKPDTAE